MSSSSWGPGFCSPLNLRESHWLSRHLHFFLYFCSVYKPWWPAGKRSGSPSAVGRLMSGCWGVAPLQLSAVRHFYSLLCSPNVPRNIMGLGLGVSFQICRTRREAYYSLPECCVCSTTLKVEAAWWTWSLGRSVGANFHPPYWQRGHLSAPRSGARVSGFDRDFCASLFCAFIHLKETWHPNRGREIRGKFEKARS